MPVASGSMLIAGIHHIDHFLKHFHRLYEFHISNASIPLQSRSLEILISNSLWNPSIEYKGAFLAFDKWETEVWLFLHGVSAERARKQ